MWPAADRDRALPTAGEMLGWGLFSTVLAVVLTVAVDAGAQRALSLGGLGLAATATLWAAARFGGDAPRGRSPGRPPTGA
jgi:hypothetical protein